MPTITITKLYDLVSVRPGKETAENLTIFIEEKIRSEVGQVIATFGFILLFMHK